MMITIIGGTPGSGKTTLARLLATADVSGLHLATDLFFDCLPHKIDPSTPAARAQNDAVLSAWCAAAVSFRGHGYNVYVDGVIGPWLLPTIQPLIGEFGYLLLHAPLETTLARMRYRTGQDSAHPSVATRMHHQFEAVLTSIDAHVLHTDHNTPEAAARVFYQRRDAGRLSFNLAQAQAQAQETQS